MPDLPGPPPTVVNLAELMENSDSDEVQFGRQRNSVSETRIPAVQIPLLTIAPFHFLITREGAHYRIADIIDDYPTQLNGKALRRCSILRDGDILEFGGLRYKYGLGVLTLVRHFAGASVNIHNFHYRHTNSDQDILSGLNLSIEPGEFVGIFGESGCGKSTLLRLILQASSSGAYQQRQGGGTISIPPVGGKSPVIGFVPQDSCLLDGLTVEGTFQLFADLFGIKDRASTIRYVLAALGIGDRATRRNRVELLSGGQRRRVNVGVELLRMPNIILLDEPDSGLDKLNRSRTMHYLATLKHIGTTVIMTTHCRDHRDLFDKVVEFE